MINKLKIALKSEEVYHYTIYILGKIIPSVLSIISVPLFLNYLGANNFGIYVLLNTTLLILISTTSGWVGQSYIRFFALHSSNNTEEALEKVIINVLKKSIFIASILLLAYLLFEKYDGFTLILLLTCLFFGIIYNYQQAQFQSKKASNQVVISDTYRFITSFSIPICIFYYTQYRNLNIVFIGLLVGYIVGLLSQGFRLSANSFRQMFLPVTGIDYPEQKEILSFGIPILFWVLLGNLFGFSDRYIMDIYFSPTQVGYYSAIYDLFSKLTITIVFPLSSAIMPIITQHHAGNNPIEINKSITKAIFIIALLSICFITALYFGKNIILYNYLHLPASSPISTMYMPLLLSLFLIQIGVILQKPLEIIFQTKLIMIILLVCFIINLGLNLWLQPIYGIKVAAFINLGTAFLDILLIIFFVKKKTDFRFTF